MAFPVAVQLFSLFFFAFAGVSGSWSRDKGGEERAGLVLGPCFVPEAGAALWVSLKQERTSCPLCHLSDTAHTSGQAQSAGLADRFFTSFVCA